MNILFICDEYPPGLNGGIGSIVQDMSRALVAKGHKVFVVGLYTYGYGQNDYQEDKGVKIWRLRYGFNFSRYKLLYRIQRKLLRPLKSFLFGQKNFDAFVSFIQRLIIEESIDIIEQPDWNTFAYDIGIKNPILPPLNIPLVIKSHGSYSYFSKELNTVPKKCWKYIDHKLYQRADAIAAVSKYTAEQNIQIFQLKQNVEVIYNALDIATSKQETKREKDLVFFSGSLVQKKGIFQLIKAWNYVIKEFPTAQLIVFGKGDTEPLKKLLITPLTVNFMGHQPKQILIKYLNSATLAVFPSYSETFGLAAVEAMSCGCPTIFTQRSCGPEIIENGVDGILIDPDDIQEISQSIIALLGDEQRRLELGKNAKEKVALKYNLDLSVQYHIEWYKSVILNFKKQQTCNK
jgi:glycogen synthase